MPKGAGDESTLAGVVAGPPVSVAPPRGRRVIDRRRRDGRSGFGPRWRARREVRCAPAGPAPRSCASAPWSRSSGGPAGPGPCARRWGGSARRSSSTPAATAAKRSPRRWHAAGRRGLPKRVPAPPPARASSGRPIRTTPLTDTLVAEGARMGVVAGWERLDHMAHEGLEEAHSLGFTQAEPLVAAEVQAVSAGCGIAEVSGVNRLEPTGRDVHDVLDRMSCSRAPRRQGEADLPPERSRWPQVGGDGRRPARRAGVVRLGRRVRPPRPRLAARAPAGGRGRGAPLSQRGADDPAAGGAALAGGAVRRRPRRLVGGGLPLAERARSGGRHRPGDGDARQRLGGARLRDPRPEREPRRRAACPARRGRAAS